MFQRKHFTLEEKKELLKAFFSVMMMMIALLVIIVALLVIITLLTAWSCRMGCVVVALLCGMTLAILGIIQQL